MRRLLFLRKLNTTPTNKTPLDEYDSHEEDIQYNAYRGITTTDATSQVSDVEYHQKITRKTSRKSTPASPFKRKSKETSFVVEDDYEMKQEDHSFANTSAFDIFERRNPSFPDSKSIEDATQEALKNWNEEKQSTVVRRARSPVRPSHARTASRGSSPSTIGLSSHHEPYPTHLCYNNEGQEAEESLSASFAKVTLVDLHATEEGMMSQKKEKVNKRGDSVGLLHKTKSKQSVQYL